jgi:hypothetical protein
MINRHANCKKYKNKHAWMPNKWRLVADITFNMENKELAFHQT